MRLAKLNELADQMKKNNEDAKRFIETGMNTDYWIGVKEQSQLTLNWLKDNDIYPTH